MTVKPKNLFLLDGLGAMLSAFLLGIILTRFESTFGMPVKVLYLLSFIACLFSAYSLFCHFKFPANWKKFLKIIAIANLLYCGITIGFVIAYYQKITTPGYLYFLIEIVIILFIARLELKTANN